MRYMTGKSFPRDLLMHQLYYIRRVRCRQFNINKLRMLNCLVTRINAVYTGGNEARNVDSDLGKRTWDSIIVGKRCEGYAQI